MRSFQTLPRAPNRLKRFCRFTACIARCLYSHDRTTPQFVPIQETTTMFGAEDSNGFNAGPIEKCA